MVNDRGTIKWTSLMLPEHVEALKKLREEENWKEKPIIDEHLIEEINLILQLALKDDLTIEVEYFKDHDYHKIKGKLLAVDPLLSYVRFEDDEIPLDSVTGARID